MLLRLKVTRQRQPPLTYKEVTTGRVFRFSKDNHVLWLKIEGGRIALSTDSHTVMLHYEPDCEGDNEQPITDVAWLNEVVVSAELHY